MYRMQKWHRFLYLFVFYRMYLIKLKYSPICRCHILIFIVRRIGIGRYIVVFRYIFVRYIEILSNLLIVLDIGIVSYQT